MWSTCSRFRTPVRTIRQSATSVLPSSLARVRSRCSSASTAYAALSVGSSGRAPGHDAWCVHGYEEKGSTTTPFDMLRLNNMDRWALAAEALRLVDAASGAAAGAGAHAEQAADWDAFREGGLPLCRGGGLRPPGLHRLGVARRARRDRGRCCSRLSATQMTAGDNELGGLPGHRARCPVAPTSPDVLPRSGGLRPRFATRAGEQPGRPGRAVARRTANRQIPYDMARGLLPFTGSRSRQGGRRPPVASSQFSPGEFAAEKDVWIPVRKQTPLPVWKKHR